MLSQIKPQAPLLVVPFRQFFKFQVTMDVSAWPFLVGGVICLVNSVNERDLSLLTSRVIHMVWVSISSRG